VPLSFTTIPTAGNFVVSEASANATVSALTKYTISPTTKESLVSAYSRAPVKSLKLPLKAMPVEVAIL